MKKLFKQLLMVLSMLGLIIIMAYIGFSILIMIIKNTNTGCAWEGNSTMTSTVVENELRACIEGCGYNFDK